MEVSGYINLKDGVVRNFYNIKKEFAEFLLNNNLSLYIDADSNRTDIFRGTDDIEHMSLKELSRRVKLT